MAYDEAVAQRLRDGLRGVRNVREKRMMGGLCMMVDGNMLGGVDKSKSGDNRFMFRVGKDNEESALSRRGASPVIMGGRKLGGFVFVEAVHCGARELRTWIDMALHFVSTLPKKP